MGSLLRWGHSTVFQWSRQVASQHLIDCHDLMKDDHDPDTRQAKPAREPVQVYLDASEQQRLERLTTQLDTTKSDVLRRGLEALERQFFDPDHHPALQIIGIAGAQGPQSDFDVADQHDRYFAGLQGRRLSDEGSGGR